MGDRGGDDGKGLSHSHSADRCPGTARSKEELWPHVREFADRAIAHATDTLARLQEAEGPVELYMIHGWARGAGASGFRRGGCDR